MSPDAGRVLAAAHALGLVPNDQQVSSLLKFLAELGRWNATYNLTALRDPQAMFTHHLVDCMAAVPPVLRWVGRRSGLKVLDVGSGGGLPGIVWAILIPELDITCVDAVGKKAAFVRQVAGELGLRVTARHARVETLGAPRFDLITSRAFSSLQDLTLLTRSSLATGGAWVALKGKAPDTEIAALGAETRVFHVEPLTVPDLDAERCLVWMEARPDSAETGHPPG
jgi:16S rRNA (guanine527-N7)-methyltransferase